MQTAASRPGHKNLCDRGGYRLFALGRRGYFLASGAEIESRAE